jgi:hypothetical protein
MTIPGGFPTRRQSFAIFLFAIGFPLSADAQTEGKFRGRVVAEWIEENDHRRMKLTEPFEFVDPRGRRWSVPSGIIVDGASIPQVFWSIIGGPFEGPYRQASVIHDRFCDTRTRSYADVHHMFYEAMLTDKVGPKKRG